MTGIERLMKSFGIDPEKIMATFQSQMTEVVQQVKAEFDMLHDRLAAVEEEQANVRKMLERIESGLLHALPDYLPDDSKNRLDEATVLPLEITDPDVPDVIHLRSPFVGKAAMIEGKTNVG